MLYWNLLTARKCFTGILWKPEMLDWNRSFPLEPGPKMLYCNLLKGPKCFTGTF